MSLYSHMKLLCSLKNKLIKSQKSQKSQIKAIGADKYKNVFRMAENDVKEDLRRRAQINCKTKKVKVKSRKEERQTDRGHCMNSKKERTKKVKKRKTE